MKKGFVIFSIVLMLFILTVPCFAVESETDHFDYEIPLVNQFSIPFASSGSRVSSDGYNFTVYPVFSDQPFYDYSGFRMSGFVPGHTYIISFTAYSNVSGSGSRFLPYDYDHVIIFNPIVFCNSSPEGTFNSFTITFPNIEDVNYLRYQVWEDANIFTYVTFDNFNVFDVTDTNLNLSNISNYVDLHSFYPLDQQFAFLIGFFDPYLNFHRDIFSHMFDFVPELTSTYSGLFIFIAIILSFCFLVFIIVFMFKKFAR